MKTPKIILLTAALSFSLAACSSSPEQSADIVVDNCGYDVAFKETPKKVMTLGPESITTLSHLGVLDRVVSRSGQYPKEYYDEATQKQLDKIPSLTDRLDASGHLQISAEEVASVGPDLVLGQTDTITHETMEAQGINVLDEPAFCGTLPGPANFEDVWRQVDMYGEVFGKQAEAEKYNSQLKDRLEKVRAPEQQHPLSVAVLYPTTGVTYAYGLRSMANPVVGAAGLRNVFDDVDDRVFEISAEELVARDPDVIISLHASSDADSTDHIPGSNSLRAVREGKVLPMLLNYAEPPTPLAIDGVEKIKKFVHDQSN